MGVNGVCCSALGSDANEIAAKYRGFTRIKRLLLVATKCPNLRGETRASEAKPSSG